MAHALVTQVQNPNDRDVELQNRNANANAPAADDDGAQPAKRQSRWQRLWASCTSCFSCFTCCQSEPEVIDQRTHGFSVTKRHRKYLLPDLPPPERHKKCLVLDLDETLVHSSFKPVPNADFVLSIELEGEIHNVYVLKRPGCDQFLEAVAKKFEVVVFTASLSKYADPLLDILDPSGFINSRLFRESCVQHYGNYVKDLSQLGRDLAKTIIIDNSPYSYIFQPDNALPISSWFNDPTDTQLIQLLPILDSLAECDNVTVLLSNLNNHYMNGDGQQQY